MASNLRPTKTHFSRRIFPGHRAHLPRSGQGPALRVSFSWEYTGVEQPRSAELALSSTVVNNKIRPIDMGLAQKPKNKAG